MQIGEEGASGARAKTRPAATIAVMHPYVVRALVGFAVIIILAIGAVPLLILLDLSGGGTGWGMCEDGLDSCRVGGFRGGRLAGLLLVGLFAIMALLRFIVWVANRTAVRKRRAATPTTNTDFFIP